MILGYTLFWVFWGVHSSWKQGAPVRAKEASASNYFCLQALLIKEISLPSSTYYFLRLFFSFPRYLLRPKLLRELQLCDTRCYKNLSLFWLFLFLSFYTFIIACFAVVPFRLKQYSLKDFFPFLYFCG